MKGTIHNCLAEAVKEKYDAPTWERCLIATGFSRMRTFHRGDDIEEEKSVQLFVKTAEVLGCELNDVFTLFGDYWSCVYAPKNYSFWYIGVKNAKEFILKLDDIHSRVNHHFTNAKPPRFQTFWEDNAQKCLRVTYTSERSLLDLYIALAKGMGKHFGEEIKAEKLSASEVRLVFPN